MTGIFINYRVGDGALLAGFLHHELVKAFGNDEAFYASRRIAPGSFFDDEIWAALHECEALLAVIGPRWLTATNTTGTRRLDDEQDWVRREIAEALARGIRVIPVLIENALMPTAEQLPPDLRDLARCNYLRLGHRHGDPDAATIINQLRRIIPRLATPTPPTAGTPEPSAASADSVQTAAQRLSRRETDALGSPFPSSTSTFTGRESELAHLLDLTDSALKAPASGAVVISTIDGMAGIGKTAIALHTAHQVAERFPDGQLFVDLHGFTHGMPPVDPSEALDRLLRALGVPPQQIPLDIEERATLYRQRLAGTRTLILLDNAATETQVRPLLPGTAGCLVLITSRRRLTALDDAHTLSLDVLPEADAIALFRAVARLDRAPENDPAVAEVVALCGYIPLAIRIAAARLRHRPTWSPAHLVGLLRDYGERLPQLDDGNRSLTTAFAISYDHLTNEHKRVFRHLGLHFGPDIDSYATAALADIDPRPAERSLETLVDHNLLNQPAPGRYQFHDLLRIHAHSLTITDPSEQRQAAIDRLLNYYTHTTQTADHHLRPHTPTRIPTSGQPLVHIPGMTTAGDASAWMTAELGNLTAAVDYAATHDHFTHAVALPIAMYSHLLGNGLWFQSLAVLRHAQTAAQHIGDLSNQATVLHGLGIVEGLTGRPAQAVDSYTQALNIFRDLDDQLGQGRTLISLSGSEVATGRFAQAIDSAAQALEIFRALDSRIGQGISLFSMANAQYTSGQFAQAVDKLTQAAKIFDELGDRVWQTIALTMLTATHIVSGNVMRALSSAAPVLKIFSSFDNRLSQIDTMGKSELIQIIQSYYPQLAVDLGQYSKLFREAGNRHEALNALNMLGMIATTGDMSDLAAEHYTQALNEAREISSPLNEAASLTGLGLSHLAAEQPEAGIRYLQQAMEIYQHLGIGIATTEAQLIRDVLDELQGDTNTP